MPARRTGYDERSWQTENDSADRSCGEGPLSRCYLPLSCTFLPRLAPVGHGGQPPLRQVATAGRRRRSRSSAAGRQSARTANYDIDVTLDPATRTLTGSELITWRNPGAIAAYSIRLHLYWNAFRNTNSTWLKQRQLAGDNPFANADAGRLRLHQRHAASRIVNADGSDGPDLMKDFRFISPDDQNTRRSIAGRGARSPTPFSRARRCGCA